MAGIEPECPQDPLSRRAAPPAIKRTPYAGMNPRRTRGAIRTRTTPALNGMPPANWATRAFLVRRTEPISENFVPKDGLEPSTSPS